VVWGLEQRFSRGRCFKIRAQHLLRLPGRVCAVTIARSLGVARLRCALTHCHAWSAMTAPSWPAAAGRLALPCGATATADPMPWPPYHTDVPSRYRTVSLSLTMLCCGPPAAAAPLSLPLCCDATAADTTS